MTIRLLPSLALLLFAPPVIQDVRVDKSGTGNVGRVIVRIDDTDRVIAAEGVRAWVTLDKTGVLYSELAAKNGGGSGERLRHFDASSTLRSTLHTDAFEIVDVMQNRMPDGRWLIVLSLRDRELGVPGVAVLEPRKGLVRRETLVAPEALLAGSLVVNRYTKDEVVRAGGDLSKAKPADTEYWPLR